MKKRLAVLVVLLATGAAAGLSACRPKPPPAGSDAAAPATHEPQSTPAASNGAGRVESLLIVPGNTASLRRYLETTQEVPAKRFDVEWHPDVVRIDRETAARALRRVSADGRFYDLNPGEPALAQLKPGRIMALWGIAVRRVKNVRQIDGVLRIDTAFASLPEIFTRANIEIDYNLRPTAPVVVPHVPLLQPPAESARTAAGAAAFMLARYETPNESQAPPESGDAAPPGPDDHVIPLGLDSWSVKDFHGFDITARYGPRGDGIAFDLQARLRQDDLSDEASGSDASADPKLLATGSELLDLRIGASGNLHAASTNDTLRVTSNIVIKDSSLALMRTDFDNVSGDLTLFFIARRGPQAEQWIRKLRVELPVRFNIPLIVGGLPFMFQVAFNFIAQPALTTKNDSFTGQYRIPFNGNGSLTLEQGKLTTSGTLQSIPQVVESLGSSIGVSAVLIGVQAPRVGLGIGLFSSSSIAYIDLVNSFTITSGGQLGMFPCKHHQLVATVNAGIDTQIVFPLEDLVKNLSTSVAEALDKINKSASARQQVFKKEWYRTEPDIKACQLDK